MTGLMNRITAAELVRAWQEANEIADQAYAELKRAEGILKTAYGDQSYMYVFPRDSRGIDGVKKDNRNSAWRAIISLLGIRKVMSQKRLDELDKSLSQDEMPALTLENVEKLSRNMLDAAPDFANEAVMEVFEFLRPGSRECNKHKTNEKNGRFDLGKKIVLTPMYVEWGWHGNRYSYTNWSVNHRSREKIQAVDRIFHLADGQGELKGYNGPLVDTINTTPTSQATCETEYFKVRMYKNGNLHLEFKRPDLVTKLNRVAGNATRLKGK